MIDTIHNDQFYILYQLEKWNNNRTSQNVFIDYRSWSGIFQTLSMYANQCNLNMNEIIFLTPIQIDAVEMSRSGIWAESFREYIYDSYSLDDDLLELFPKYKGDLNNTFKLRDHMVYRSDNQVRPKLVVILNAELISPQMLKDCNKLLKMQTIVCYDSAKYFDSDSIVNHVKKPIMHTFLNDEINDAQKFLYNIIDKKIVPLSKTNDVRVFEYTRSGLDFSKMPKPILSAVRSYAGGNNPSDKRIIRGSLVYTNNYNWKHSLEDNRYYLIKGAYLIVDRITRGDVPLISAHPTYTKFRFKTVPNVKCTKVTTPCLIDNMPPWKFAHGSIIVPKVLKSLQDAQRIYNAANMFRDQLVFYIV